MLRAKLVAACVGVVLIGLISTAAPAGAAPNNRVDVIRGQGSDTTVDLMQNLDRAFNNTDGCVKATSSLFRLDHECLVQGPPYHGQPDATVFDNWDHDVGMTFSALGSSNGIRMLSFQGQTGIAQIEYARSSRARSGSDNPGLRFVGFALDALGPVTFQGDVDPDTCAVKRDGQFPEFDDSGPLDNGPDATVPNDLGTWPDGPDPDGPGGSTVPGEGCPDATVASSVSDVSDQVVKDIYRNCGGSDTPTDVAGNNNGIMDWQDLDPSKPAIPIVVWNTQTGSGTRGSWNFFITGSDTGVTDACIPAPMKDNDLSNGNRVIFEHDATPIVHCVANGDCPDENGGDGFGVHYTHSFFYYGVGAHSVTESDPKGEGTDFLSINGKFPTFENIQNDDFFFTRTVNNVYRQSFSANNATTPTLDYIGENGWICKAADRHVVNPRSGLNYREEIDAVIAGTGFVPLPLGPTGGGGPDSHCRVG